MTFSTKWIRTVALVSLTLLLISSLAIWLFRQERLPRTIRIATGELGGLYEKVGTSIEGSIHQRTDRPVVLVESAGSAENFLSLMDREVDLAIVQGDSVPIEDASVVTPLFREFVFVIVRRDRGIESVTQLAGKAVCLGALGSGGRDAAIKLINHFGIKEGELQGDTSRDFREMESDRSIDAAIVTAGIEHPAVRRLLATNEFELVPIRSAMAMELIHPFFRNVEIPRGLFAEHPAVPSESIPAIATTAFLIAREDAPAKLVQASLESIHEESLRLKFPTLIVRQEVSRVTATRMHPTARVYFNPSDNMGIMLNVMESAVATKELLFAIGAGLYLIWSRYRRLKEEELQESLTAQKEHLDRFLSETLRIEREQMRSEDVGQLQKYLDSVTKLKLRSLHEFTEEELRGNQSFMVFLNQCSSLIGKIQMKILSLQRST